jgi:DNA-binding MarR family transcriptional regulator
MMSRIPIPLTGTRAIFAGTVMIIFGLLALYNGYKLPLAEALDLIHRKGRGITESEIVHDMRVDRATARRILDGLIAKGFLRRATDQPGAAEEVFEPVR